MLATTLPDWLDVETLRTALLVSLVVVIVAAVVVARGIQKLVLRFIVLAALIALGVSLWAQRAELGDCAQQCACRLYGQDVVLSDDRVQQACEARREQEQPGVALPR